MPRYSRVTLFPASFCRSSTVMLGIYAGIFLLLLIIVLTCAVSSCGSVHQGFFQGWSGRAGWAGGGEEFRGKWEEEARPAPGPHPWLALLLG